jgi:peptidoglycan/xylan/chitin deacetylase (PgdA/CDA1 family)
MAATPLPGRTRQTADPRSLGRPRLRVRWDRISVLFGLVAVLATVVAHTVVVALSTEPRAVAAKPVPIEVTEQPANTHRECPLPATEVVRTAPTDSGNDSATARTVALTFDDGPGPSTPAVLEVLQQAGVHATFFVIGRQAAAQPEMLQRIIAGGHAIGDHSWSHTIPTLKAGWNSRRLAAEIERTNHAIFAATGIETCVFRPPGGVVKGAKTVTRRAGLSMILWSVDPRDWAAPPNQKFAPVVRKRVAAGLREHHPVILLHDGGGNRAATVAALTDIISDYRSHGYRFVTLDEHR